jgi:hypothetical protein
MNPNLRIQQKLTVFTNIYEVFDASEGIQSEKLIAFAEQAKLKIKEKISFYSDASKSNLLFTLRAEKVIDVHGSYFIEDGNGGLIGFIKKDFKRSLFQSSWLVSNQAGVEVLRFEEDNPLVAILRRIADFIPVGDLIKFFPYHFAVTEVASGNQVGRYQKVSVFRDRYVLHLDENVSAATDQRLLIGMSIALDALQSR